MKEILVSIFLFLTVQAQAQDFDKGITEKIDRQIEQYVEGISPGVAVGIVRNGEIIYEKYIGYSNLEHEIKISDETRFNIASNAKQYTALCILKLIEEGKISLEDDIRKYLPDLYKANEDNITISNLLTHTSGIRDVYDLWALKGQTWWKQFIDNGDAMELLQSQVDLNFKPTTEYLYSNSNYILLTEIIKKVTGEKFSEIANYLFTDLGMSNTAFQTNYMAIVPNKARPYGNWDGWKEYPFITETHGDGALFTTLADQLKWEKVIQLKNEQHLSRKLIDLSQSKIPSSTSDTYGYGLMFGEYKDLAYTYHDGSTGAYNATFLRFAERDLAIVVMSNNGNLPTNYLAKQLMDIALDLKDSNTSYKALPDKIEVLSNVQDVLGNYKNGDGTVISISEREGSIYREIYQREPVKLLREEDGLFHYETNQDLKMNFSHIGAPTQKFTIYLSTQAPSTYYKQADFELNKSELNGSFYNQETDTEIIINFVEGNKYTITKNGRERQAELILKDYLRMMSSYEIRIVRNEENNIIGLNVKNGRIKNVIFNKM